MSKTTKIQKSKGTSSLVKKEYTDEEKATIAKYFERCKREPVKFKSWKDASGNSILLHEATDETSCVAKFTETFGTHDKDLT